MIHVADAAVISSRSIVLGRTANDRLASVQRANDARRRGIPHWNVAFLITGERNPLSIVTYAHDRRGAIACAKKPLKGVEYTLLWAFETLDRERVHDLLSSAKLRLRYASRGNDFADADRARVDVVRFQRELETLEAAILV